MVSPAESCAPAGHMQVVASLPHCSGSTMVPAEVHWSARRDSVCMKPTALHLFKISEKEQVMHLAEMKIKILCCREQSSELATSSSKSSHGSGRVDSSSQSGQLAAAPDTQGNAEGEPQAEDGAVAQQEQESVGAEDNMDAEEPEEGKTVTRPLPWLTWLAQKLYAQVAPCISFP